MLDELIETKYPKELQEYIFKYRDKKKPPDVTILHTAASIENDDPTIIDKLLQIEPRLLYLQRKEIYQGQTALHIAVARGNNNIVKELLKKDKECRRESNLEFSKQLPIHELLADGRRFKNTILMGQTPLSVAALKSDMKMVDILIRNEANICQINSLDETIFHSIIRYAAVRPEKEIEMIKMCGHLNNHIQDEKSHGYRTDMFIWFQRNKEKMTALQLAAFLGTIRLFEFIVNLKNIYCFQADHDGLFDIKKYDITEIDSVTAKKAVTYEEEILRKSKINTSNVENVKQSDEIMCGCTECICPPTESILEMMCNSNKKENIEYVQKLVEIVPVKNVIRLKWEKYRWFHYLWMTIHIIFISFLTGHSVIRAEFYEVKIQSSYNPNIDENLKYYVDVLQIFGFLLSIIYLLIFFTVFVVKTKKPPNSFFLKYSNNIQYLLLLLSFSVCLIIDSSIHWLGKEELTNSGFLIAALIFGWWFMLFFLRATYYFSFFTELIGRVIFGDLLRFSIVIGFELISFTAGMSIMFTGKTIEETSSNGTSYSIPDDNFAGYFNTMLTMFKLMLGLGDIDILYEAKSPGIAIALFIFFVIFAYVLMLNALIAMMSVTCASVLEGRYRHWRMQQLSVMLFFEEMSYLFCLSNRLPYLGDKSENMILHSFKKESRVQFLLEIHSLEIDLASPEDKDQVMKTMEMNTNFETEKPTSKLKRLKKRRRQSRDQEAAQEETVIRKESGRIKQPEDVSTRSCDLENDTKTSKDTTQRASVSLDVTNVDIS